MLILIVLIVIAACVWTMAFPRSMDPVARRERAMMIGAAALVIALCGIASLMGWA